MVFNKIKKRGSIEWQLVVLILVLVLLAFALFFIGKLNKEGASILDMIGLI